MALGDFARRLLWARRLPHGGEPDSPEPVSSDAEHWEPVSTTVDDFPPLIFGSMRSAREHAQALADILRETGSCNRAIYQGEIAELHARLCEELGWMPKKWDAVGRELAKLPGVRRGEFKLNGTRLTAYEVEPAAETTESIVVPHAAVERKRAVGQ
jgi:hypothetical protein